MEKIKKYDTIIIGTGAGGSTISKDLAKKQHNILILEKGKHIKTGQYLPEIKTKQIKLKTTEPLTQQEKEKYPFLEQPLDLSYIEDVGGTTTVSLGNACFSCTGCYDNSIMAQFEKNNLNITPELLEISDEINVKYFHNKNWGETTKKIADAGRQLNYEIEAMPKFIDFKKCTNCGKCVAGCTTEGKWDATQFIKEATQSNAKLKTEFTVTKILHNNRKVEGVEGINKNGKTEKYHSKTVVLSAGAINTPLILKNSGINAGNDIFLDIFTTIGGYLPNNNLKNELQMGIKAEFGPYFLSPHYSSHLKPLIEEKGYKNIKDQDIVGIMLKFADDNKGTINKNKIDKTLTKKDINIIKEGYEKAEKLLLKIGVEPESIVATSLKGAHPGGTAPLGKITDNNFQTKIKGLYISDASVIPEAPGRPPILTILAISRKVSNIINNEIKK